VGVKIFGDLKIEEIGKQLEGFSSPSPVRELSLPNE
jgi:hypothetical protein